MKPVTLAFLAGAASAADNSHSSWQNSYQPKQSYPYQPSYQPRQTYTQPSYKPQTTYHSTPVNSYHPPTVQTKPWNTSAPHYGGAVRAPHHAPSYGAFVHGANHSHSPFSLARPAIPYAAAKLAEPTYAVCYINNVNEEIKLQLG